MHPTLKRWATQAHGIVREAAKNLTRSPAWHRISRAFRRLHPSCAACGGKRFLQVHHCDPFHLNPPKELDPDNLLVLCMGRLLCHLKIGHADNYKAFNPLVRQHAAACLQSPEKRVEIEAMAVMNRRYEEAA